VGGLDGVHTAEGGVNTAAGGETGAGEGGGRGHTAGRGGCRGGGGGGGSGAERDKGNAGRWREGRDADGTSMGGEGER
jgi:hypothetical protein